MIVTFPHIGDISYVMSGFFNELGVPCVVPPENDSETMQAGIELSPEEMCMPFKFMIGNLKRAYDMGADTAVMAATCGPCRLGEYCQLMMEVMENAGCSYKWVLLDSPSEIGLKAFVNRFLVLLEGRDIGRMQLMKQVLRGINMMLSMDRLRRKAERRAGYLDNPYEAVEVLHDAKRRLKDARDFSESMHILKDSEKRLSALSENRLADPVKVMITGEIYTSIEDAANGRLSERLMLMGCSVRRHLSLTWWLRHTAADALIPERIYDMFDAKGGIPCNVGGYGRQTISKILRCGDCDGMIKIMPAGCMPEIVAKAFCEGLEDEDDRRILHLVYDELSGDAGYQTRTEAFVDMLERRKYVLAGNRHRLHKH